MTARYMEIDAIADADGRRYSNRMEANRKGIWNHAEGGAETGIRDCGELACSNASTADDEVKITLAETDTCQCDTDDVTRRRGIWSEAI